MPYESAPYELRFAQGVAKSIARLTRTEQERIKAAVRSLAHEPRGHNTKKLRGTELFRLRIGTYRVIYGIQDEQLLIIILEVMQRGRDYQSLDSLIKRWRSLVRKR